MLKRRTWIPLGALLMLTACAHYPSGPSVMVLPGGGKSFGQFQDDDALCRSFAQHQSGTPPRDAAAENAIASAAVGTAVGAAAGAAIGAAAGDPGAGAAIGAGSGLLVGAASGSRRAEWAGRELQGRYDDAYLQCMYANGNQIPLPRGSISDRRPPPRPRSPAAGPPPPPPGYPPPPPPDA